MVGKFGFDWLLLGVVVRNGGCGVGGICWEIGCFVCCMRFGCLHEGLVVLGGVVFVLHATQGMWGCGWSLGSRVVLWREVVILGLWWEWGFVSLFSWCGGVVVALW